MKVLFDTQIYDWQINGGISRYFTEVIQRLDAKPEVDVMFNCTHSYNTYLQNTKWLKLAPQITGVNFKGKLRIVKKVNQFVNRRWSNAMLKSGKQDLFHPTYYDPYFLDYIGSKPFVLTVHDLINEKFNDNSALTQKVLGWKKKLILKAAHIIAVSEHTKNDMLEYYKVDADKITVVHLAASFNSAMAGAVGEGSIFNKPYILFVGSRSGYKNFNNFIVESAALLQKHNLNLVIAGGDELKPHEVSLLKSLDIYNQVEALPHVSDQHLAQLYTNAMIFVFPSLYEGFGIPVLEAMQCGCPALLSNNSSLPEVGGDAAQYFDPQVKGALKKELDELISNEELRHQMKTKGLEQCKQFNWQFTANKHADIYRKIKLLS